ncbi:hypothetical protein H109_00886 [Trichophyton interdigitale MR816]|uniref:Uncharacterized protein n=1 Tax=Trichophyton interdigitale (strain MR816) TaxID=1215338 RepID=A0A059JHP9_TRIIM|nr:hypothetical protein H109_00886 [Trichophyton interdigitale MR816]
MSEPFSTSAVSYAGPLLTAEPGMETPSQPSRRIKRREDSSENKGFAILGDTRFKNEDYRCGGPGLVRLPTLNEILKPSEPLYILYHEELVGPLRDVLEKWNVESRFINLVRLKIEISDERALEPVFSRPIPATDPFTHKWPDLKSRILNILKGSEWTLLSAHLRGPRNGPFIRTIIICVREDSIHNWNDVRASIVHHLDTNDLTHIAVEIIRDSIFHCSGQESENPVHHSLLEDFLNYGSFHHHHHHQWKRYGVTNFHSTANYPCLDDWKRHGIMPDDSRNISLKQKNRPDYRLRRNHLTVDHPSHGNYNKSIKHYEKESLIIQTQEYYETKKRMEDEDPSLPKIKIADFKYDTDLLNRYIKTKRSEAARIGGMTRARQIAGLVWGYEHNAPPRRPQNDVEFAAFFEQNTLLWLGCETLEEVEGLEREDARLRQLAWYRGLVFPDD